MHAKITLRVLYNIWCLLCNKMCDVNEDDDDDEWVPSKAASTCIELMSKNLRDDMLQHVMPIVNSWIGDTGDWKKREAAAYAFGALMEGSSLEKMAPIVKQAIIPLMKLATTDQSPKVRDTSLWTIARICECKFAALDQSCYDSLFETILKLLPQSPSLASHAILALYHIGLSQMDYSGNNTNLLTKYYQHVLTGLLNIASSNDLEKHQPPPRSARSHQHLDSSWCNRHFAAIASCHFGSYKPPKADIANA